MSPAAPEPARKPAFARTAARRDSDTRASLRRFFEVDRHHVVLAALTALRTRGEVDAATCAEAMTRYGLSPDARPSWEA